MFLQFTPAYGFAFLQSGILPRAVFHKPPGRKTRCGKRTQTAVFHTGKSCCTRVASSPSQSPSVPALPKGEPLAVHANFISLPRPLPLGEVDANKVSRRRGRARCPFPSYFSASSSTFSRCGISSGFAMWPFMPAFKAFCLSSSKALAVMAKMGMPALRGSGRARMRRVAS